MPAPLLPNQVTQRGYVTLADGTIRSETDDEFRARLLAARHDATCDHTRDPQSLCTCGAAWTLPGPEAYAAKAAEEAPQRAVESQAIARRALAMVNEHLNLQLGCVYKGDELKGWRPDPEDGGGHKFYLSADECARLSSAFAVLSSALRTGRLKPEDPK